MCLKNELPNPARREEQVRRVKNKGFGSIIFWCIKDDPEERPTMTEVIKKLKLLYCIWFWPIRTESPSKLLPDASLLLHACAISYWSPGQHTFIYTLHRGNSYSACTTWEQLTFRDATNGFLAKLTCPLLRNDRAQKCHTDDVPRSLALGSASDWLKHFSNILSGQGSRDKLLVVGKLNMNCKDLITDLYKEK